MSAASADLARDLPPPESQALRFWPPKVETWLQCKPQPYILLDNHAPSTGTRPPKPFDLHLAPELQLKRLVFSESLPRKISAICDRRIAVLQQECTSIRNPPGKQRRMMSSALANPPDILEESGLVGHYIKRTAAPCLLLASAIAFGPNSDWESIFEWKVQTANNGATALCDGFLFIDKVRTSPLSLTQRKDIELIEKHRLGHLVIHEFKSLVAGDLSTMEAIVNLAKRGAFDWMSCYTAHPVAEFSKCDDTKHYKKGIPSKTGRTTGPDALGIWDELDFSMPSTTTQMFIIDMKEQKACNIMQQVFSEMVNVDATLAVISSGNIEILLKRNRATGTLYVSDILYPHETTDPSHYRLHTSLYYVGYIDALDRARQIDGFLRSLKDSSSSGLGVSSPKWTAKYFSNLYEDDSYYANTIEMTVDSGLLEYDLPNKKLRERAEMAKIVADGAKELLKELVKANKILIRLPRSKTVFDKPQLFSRKGVSRKAEIIDGLDLHSEDSDGIPTLKLEDHEDPRAAFSESPLRINFPLEDYDQSSMCLRIATSDARSSSFPAGMNDNNTHNDSNLGKIRSLKAGSYLQIQAAQLPLVGGHKAYSASILKFVTRNDFKLQIRHELVAKVAVFPDEKLYLLKDYEGHRRNPALVTYGLFESVGKTNKCDVLLLHNGGQTLDSLLKSDLDSKTKKAYLDEIRSRAMANLHSKGLQHNRLDPSHILCTGNEKKRKFKFISYSNATEIPAWDTEIEEGPERKRAKILEDEEKFLWALNPDGVTEGEA